MRSWKTPSPVSGGRGDGLLDRRQGGTAITLTVPVRMATLRGLLVRSERQVYVLPMQQVKQVLRVRPDSLAIAKGGRPTISLGGGETIEVIRLTDAWASPPRPALPGRRSGQSHSSSSPTGPGRSRAWSTK
ncbi:hypothetical protein [Methanoculleus chikugoensis]|uniref:hypothetical protein n=1 Tax=Methanoculleus chikugoensis TaxID=118126 RepID=UPI000A71E445|nr:hypothetical protein [Methanoculleus chikugoensis]